MDFFADEFVGAPRGRFLPRVATVAGSTQLQVPGGELRPSDAGKLIAIPGAGDLDTTISALARHQIVSAATMAAGSRELRGILLEHGDAGHPERQQPFRADLHVGRRITVDGAGPGGARLVTDITAVVGRDAVELTAPAVTGVSGSAVHLNAPDRVGLDNYARRALDGRTVALAGRTLTDGVVTLGGGGLVSATARFSFADLGTPIRIESAGLFLTRIEAVQDPTGARLRDPAPRSVADALADVWDKDMRQDFERLLDAFRSADPAGGEIRFGPGVYDFGRLPRPSRVAGAITLRGLRHLTLRGSGAGATILRLLPGQDLGGGLDTHLIETFDCAGLRIRDLSLHGSYLTLGNASEQAHGINLNTGTQDVVLERVRVFQTAGDGIRLLGAPDGKVREVTIERCHFVQNKRTGISFQRGAQAVLVRNCHIDTSPPSTDASIDFEPTGSGAPSDIVIDSTVISHRSASGIAVSLSGISGADPLRRVTFSNNHIRGGTIFCTDVRQLVLRDNVLVASPGQDRIAGIPLHVQRGGDGLLISGNLVADERGTTAGAIVVSQVNDRPVNRSLIANNICHIAAGAGIVVDSVRDISVDSNLLVAVGQASQAVLVRSASTAVEGIAVRDNSITAKDAGRWETGVHLAAQNPFGQVSITGNTVAAATWAVRFAGQAFQQIPVCGLNRIEPDVTEAVAGLEALPEHSVVISGAATGGLASAGCLIAGLDHPEGRVTGALGDMYQRIGPASGPRLFVKEAATSPTTGWTAK
ncbi:right-handed parallel beta-helix repeat-containing protein [Phytohabitans houttuyneae]|uniref:Right handed beta helix domain-containing protein n=1 Tax=Phytohabitans houttuyneae TaxID=1076126 RepID=A0A6V8KI58_9ACTN|nr:right-handed parallel beta-helix repeat-containing protein [Phytohabitans houttuyneae]GFJ82088.1 hypothetical protein Phou_062680 [Phytohabitans houttuyneae]